MKNNLCEKGGLPVVPNFHPGSCYICKAVKSEKVDLKRCSSCKMISYCGEKHQRQHWNKHKKLCKFMHENFRPHGIEGLFEDYKEISSHKQWLENIKLVLPATEHAFGRKFEPWEQQMFQFPRVCNFCYSPQQQKLEECNKCFSVAYCSEKHHTQDESKHKPFCEKMLLSLLCEKQEADKGLCEPIIPCIIADVYQPLTSTFIQYLEAIMSTENNSELDPVQVALLSDHLTFPVSLMFILEQVGIANGLFVETAEELIIHVLGARLEVEVFAVVKWEVMFHHLPKLKTLRLCFIGPEVGKVTGKNESLAEMCTACKSSKRQTHFKISPLSYKEFLESSSVLPHAVISFNSSLYENSEIDMWDDTLGCVKGFPNTPFIFTSYTESEIKKDLNTLEDFAQAELDVLVPPQMNPFCSLRPYRDWESENNIPVFYKNQYVSAVTFKS